MCVNKAELEVDVETQVRGLGRLRLRRLRLQKLRLQRLRLQRLRLIRLGVNVAEYRSFSSTSEGLVSGR